ncbi:unnamed protein product [Sphenostylis stenocarpa]|uniref:Uncharacterized protein n=1 Tax=Sphenostylis stenocarpa TaxID=92480 RepID=A0AA86SW08_9FABA|nr:unnamed protein product [Sphenostylis stenocarpa]
MAEDTIPVGGGDSSSAARAPSSFVKKGDRQMFTVELRPGETTIVSWKKLMKDANKFNNKGLAAALEHLPNVNPALESRIAPFGTEIRVWIMLGSENMFRQNIHD